jgi:hypothetical protein
MVADNREIRDQGGVTLNFTYGRRAHQRPASHAAGGSQEAGPTRRSWTNSTRRPFKLTASCAAPSPRTCRFRATTKRAQPQDSEGAGHRGAGNAPRDRRRSDQIALPDSPVWSPPERSHSLACCNAHAVSAPGHERRNRAHAPAAGRPRTADPPAARLASGRTLLDVSDGTIRQCGQWSWVVFGFSGLLVAH